MVQEREPMTRSGYYAMQLELDHLKQKERPAIVKAIAIAREHGDLSENAEYKAAREQQSLVEGKIQSLEEQLSRAEVIDTTGMSGAVKFGATVTLVDEETEEKFAYRIVGEFEADVRQGMINVKSPLARALIGHNVGDVVDVMTPKGGRSYRIFDIQFL